MILSLERYDNTQSRRQKINLTASFCDYLSKLNDTEKIKAGVNKIVILKILCHRLTEVLLILRINAGLQKIAAAKGGDVQAYVDNALK